MSKKGGYLIIDLKNYDLLITIEGASALPIKYCKELIQLLEQNFNKQILISGITINKIEKNDCIVNVYHYDTYYMFTLYGLSFKLSEGGLKPSNSVISDSKEIETPLTSSTNSVKISITDFPYNRNIYVLLRAHASGSGSESDNYAGFYIPIISTNSYVTSQTTAFAVRVESTEDYFTLTVNGDLSSLEVYVTLYYID